MQDVQVWSVEYSLVGVHASREMIPDSMGLARVLAAAKPYWDVRTSAVLVVAIFFHFLDTSKTCMVICTAVESQYESMRALHPCLQRDRTRWSMLKLDI
jgi:hypothetical protein